MPAYTHTQRLLSAPMLLQIDPTKPRPDVPALVTQGPSLKPSASRHSSRTVALYSAAGSHHQNGTTQSAALRLHLPAPGTRRQGLRNSFILWQMDVQRYGYAASLVRSTHES